MNQGDNHFFYHSAAPDDSFFTAIGKAAEEEMLMECGLWERQADEIDIPENVETQILTLARKHEKKQLNIKRDRFIRRYAKMAGAVVLMLSAAFSVFLAGSEALRGNVFQFVFQDSDTYMKVIPVETSDPGADAKKNIPPDWKGVYYPDYLPEEYEFTEANAEGKAKTIVFENRKLDVLILTQEPADGAEILIDKEGAETGETSIQGNPAFWTSKEGETTLMWNQYGILFMLYAPMDLDEITKIAEHLLYVN